MKCVAVGDMMIPSIYFRRELEKSSIIDEFICKSWKENSSKDDFREVIRKIETQGAAIDVFPTEPVSKDEPLLKLDNITVTNHQGGATVESYVKAPEMVLDMLKHSLE